MSDRPSGSREFLKRALESGSSCPPVEALLERSDSPEVQSHLEVCAKCRTEAALAREFEANAARPEEQADLAWIKAELARRAAGIPPTASAEPSGLRHWMAGLFAPRHRYAFGLTAAAALVVVAAGVYYSRPESDGLRPPSQVVWRSGQIPAVSPVGDVTSAPEELRWELVPTAASYEAVITGVDGARLWNSTSTAATAKIPADVRAQFVSGRAFHWSVRALNSGGATIASTDLQTFHILTTSR